VALWGGTTVYFGNIVVIAFVEGLAVGVVHHVRNDAARTFVAVALIQLNYS